MNKKAFSMPEILIVLTIIALVAVTFLTTLRPNTTMVYKKLYYNAYRSLYTAAYNINGDVEDFNTKLIEDAENANEPEPSQEQFKKFPETTQELCSKLCSTEEGYINTSFPPNCSKTVNAYGTGQFNNKTPEELKDMATFIASNGMMYFMSPMDAEKNVIVWVDLNGQRNPNTAEWKENKPSDIVPFKITSTGKVQPLGAPTYDTRYLTARIRYSDPDVDKDSKIMSFAAAKTGAFGNTVYPYDPMSLVDPISIPAEAKARIEAPSQDPKCPARSIEEFPSCSVVVEEQLNL